MARQAYAPTPLIRIVVQKENAGLFDARWFPARSLPAHFRCFPCGGLRRRTPGPPPFSSMNSTPAISKVRRTARSLAAVIDVSLSASSARRIGVVQKTWLKRLGERFVSERNVQPKDVYRGRARGTQSQPRAATRLS